MRQLELAPFKDRRLLSTFLLYQWEKFEIEFVITFWNWVKNGVVGVDDEVYKWALLFAYTCVPTRRELQ